MSTTTALLEVRDLRVDYGAVEAVRGVDLAVEQGELVALLGANGAGKSSTLNALIGLVSAAAGSVRFAGTDISRLPTESLVRRGITLVPEGRRVFASLSVAENLMLGAYAVKDAASRARARQRVLDLFPVLAERRTQLAGTLSGGQQQMLALGRALMSEPRMLLLDEPSLGLAPRIVEQIFELIAALRTQGVTILMVEQNVAMSLAIVDRGYVMSNGLMAASGSAAELRASGVVEAAYLGAA